MDITLSHCFLTVDDHDAALGFYRDLLGMTVVNDVAYEGLRWVTLGLPAQPGIEIVLESPLADPGASADDRRAVADLLAKGHLRAVILSAGDLDATFERLRSGGAEVLQEPMDQDYGARDCAVRDPAGNLIRINQRTTG